MSKVAWSLFLIVFKYSLISTNFEGALKNLVHMHTHKHVSVYASVDPYVSVMYLWEERIVGRESCGKGCKCREISARLA